MKRLFIPVLLAFLLSIGMTGAVSAQNDTMAEIQKLAEDFQAGKIDMATFQKRMTELQSRAMEQLTTPEQRKQIESQKQADQNQLMQGMGGMMKEQEAKQSVWEEMTNWKIAQAGKYTDGELAFPSSIAALVPKTGLKESFEEDSQEAKLDITNAYVTVRYEATRADWSEEALKDPYTDLSPMRTEFTIVVRSVNPKWISLNDSLPKGNAETASKEFSASDRKGNIKTFSWGAGLRGGDDYSKFAAYKGWSKDGSVYFEMSIRGDYMPNISEWDAIAEKLAATAAKDCTWDKMVD